MKKIYTIFILILLNVSLLAQSGWFWQNPLPQGNRLYDIVETENNTLYSCGEMGTIMKSSDNGNSWIIQNRDSLGHFYAIYFINDNTGWAAGGLNEISLLYFTSNGGEEWMKQIYDTTCELREIFFVNQNTGWIVGGYIDRNVIYKTTDSGISWSKSNISVDDDLLSIFFLNDQTGWACVGNCKIFKSTDTGNSWLQVCEIQNPWPYMRSLYFISDDTGYAASNHGLYKTVNSGYNWTSIQSGTFDYVKFLSHDTGFTIGGAVFKTTNAGLNWTSFTAGNAYLFGGSFTNSGNYYVVGEYGDIFKSIDVGETWISMKTGIDENSLEKIHFINPETGWLICGIDLIPGGNARLYKSIDGGSNWTQVFDFPYMIRSISVLKGQTMWAGGGMWDDGKILKSTDGGINWEVKLDVLATGIYDVCFLNERTGWAVGRLGRITKTTNGGENWTYNSSGSPGDNVRIQMLNSSTGWIANNGYGLFKTTDAGQSWLSIQTSYYNFNDIYFIDAETGWAVGLNSAILKTTDEGLTWIPKNPGYNHSHWSVFFSDHQTGWITSYGGIISKTTDGGENWYKQFSGTLNSVGKLFFFNSLTGWALGEHSTILKTTTGGDVIMDIRQIHKSLPHNYSLSQNYPNPFNPKSKIKFDIKKLGDVKLIIYDILGREVATLINGNLKAGTYETEWDGSNYSSGVYFYKLITAGYTETRKMVLVK